MKPNKPFNLDARIYECVFHFDGEHWTRTTDANEEAHLKRMFDRILEQLNSEGARRGLLYVEPRYAHAQAMLDYAAGPGEWEILSATLEEAYDELGEEDPKGPSVEVPPEWGLDKKET